MSAKKYSPSAKSKAVPVSARAPAPTIAVPAVPLPATAEADTPQRRLIARIVLAALWLYVAALWLLALDQWFNWGIFGPKTPPIP